MEAGREHDDIQLVQRPIDGADPAWLDAVDRIRDEDCVGSLDRVVEVARDDETFAGGAVVRCQPMPELGITHLHLEMGAADRFDLGERFGQDTSGLM